MKLIRCGESFTTFNMAKSKNQRVDVTFEAIKDMAKEITPATAERFVKLTPRQETSIEEWREVMRTHFPELLQPAEAGLSVIAQLLIQDIKNPFALVYVDVPSSGKTVTLNFFSTLKELVYTTDNFTPASFVSHSAKTSKKDLQKNDMLPQIRYKTLMIRDLAPVFSKKDEDVQAMLGILIRVLDGEGLETNSGLHGKRGYVGDYLFMLLSASTPIRPRIWKIMGNLGSRLFFLNINGVEKDEEALADQLKHSCRDKEILCRETTENFVKTLWQKYPDGVRWDKEKDDSKLTQVIARFAKVLARLRSSINVWEEQSGSKKYNHTQPVTEMPDRLNQYLYNFARGHALIEGRTSIGKKDLAFALKVALDSAPPNRSKIFKHLISSGGTLGTEEVMSLLKCSRPTALKHMQELSILGLVETEGDMDDETVSYGGRPEQRIILSVKYEWFLSEECKELLNHRGQISLLTKSDPVSSGDDCDRG